MQLKRIYNTDGKEPVLDYIKITQYSKRQNFTQKFINRGIKEEFLSIKKGIITLHTVPELQYKIVRTPGLFCCFDNEKMADTKSAEAYIADNFPGEKSPDGNNPNGFRQDNFFHCELIVETDNG